MTLFDNPQAFFAPFETFLDPRRFSIAAETPPLILFRSSRVPLVPRGRARILKPAADAGRNEDFREVCRTVIPRRGY
jgi:hypothetical protein